MFKLRVYVLAINATLPSYKCNFSDRNLSKMSDVDIVDLIKKRGQLKVAVLRDHGLTDQEIKAYKNNPMVSCVD